MSQYDTTFDLKNKCRSLWPIFHGPVILPYILKTVWCMNIILQDYESVWPNIWHQNKCRSLWPIFHGPVILPYILKTVWCMNIILQDYESVWPDIWPQNKCRSFWHILWPSDFALYLEAYLIYEHHTLGLWVGLTRCTPQNKCRLLWPIFHGPVILPYILKTVCCMNFILQDYETVWPDIWHKNKCRSQWPIFYNPVILPYILNSIWWMIVMLLENVCLTSK